LWFFAEVDGRGILELSGLSVKVMVVAGARAVGVVVVFGWVTLT
jgi:hypothetical protein